MNPRLSAAIATLLWGCTYIVSTTMLPPHPLLLGAVRALGAAVILLLLFRQTPPSDWLRRVVILGTLNGGLFFGLLFVAAIRLPGGVAAIFQAMGPLIVILLAWAMLSQRPNPLKAVSVVIGAMGVSLVVLKANAQIDAVGVFAALGSTVSLALGGILLNKWGRPPMPMAAFTGWQLLIAGLELSVSALVLNDFPSSISAVNLLGFAILAIALTAIPFLLWFNAIAGAGAVAVAPFFLLVPITAFALDAVFRGVIPSPMQLLGVAIVITGLLLSQRPVTPSR